MRFKKILASSVTGHFISLIWPAIHLLIPCSCICGMVASEKMTGCSVNMPSTSNNSSWVVIYRKRSITDVFLYSKGKRGAGEAYSLPVLAPLLHHSVILLNCAELLTEWFWEMLQWLHWAFNFLQKKSQEQGPSGQLGGERGRGKWVICDQWVFKDNRMFCVQVWIYRKSMQEWWEI